MRLKLIELDKTEPGDTGGFRAQYDDDHVVVYQAFNPVIAEFAAKNQCFGDEFSFKRTSWIKPSFLWTMARSGWGQKENQERILAIGISVNFFNSLIENAVLSHFDESIYPTHESWRKKLASTDVVVQFDPDRDVFGVKQRRKAIQLGLKRNTLKSYATAEIVFIEDISDYVRDQYLKLKSKRYDEMRLPVEELYKTQTDSPC